MHQAPPLPCYFNGEFTLLPDARISVMDRDFIFDVGVYEVVPVYAGQSFRPPQHLARPERSLVESRLPKPLSTGGVACVTTNDFRWDRCLRAKPARMRAQWKP